VAGGDAVGAYAIGTVEQEPSGDDTTLLLLEVAPGKSRNRLQALLREAGFSARFAAVGRIADKDVADEILLEVDGFVAKGDARLSALVKAAGGTIVRIMPIGGYANPIPLSSAATTGAA
jgi:hypothetical protein